jgi:C4-dicarboxylate-specific signal transduction histidine kinase
MRQPVAGVLALAGAALAEPGLPQPARARLEQIVEQAERMADMIQDWLYAALPSEPGDGADLYRIISEAVAAECSAGPMQVNVA